MFRVLALCALMVLGVESFRNRLTRVKLAEYILNSHLSDDNGVGDTDLSYLILIGSIFYPALELLNSDGVKDVNKLYADSLPEILPAVEENPHKALEDLKYVIHQNALALEPLIKVVSEECSSLTDHSCNSLVKGLLKSGKHPDLERAVAVLDKADVAARVFLTRNPKLEKLAESSKLRSFQHVVTNPHVDDHILIVSDWLRAILPLAGRHN